MTSPYLDRPLLPLDVAPPQMLAKIASELRSARSEEKRRLESRARLIQELLAPARSPKAAAIAHAGLGSDRVPPG